MPSLGGEGSHKGGFHVSGGTSSNGGTAYAESIEGGKDASQRYPWLRHIRIVFSSKKAIKEDEDLINAYMETKKITRPANLMPESGLKVTLDSYGGENLDIRIQGTKALALTRDCGCITIANISYDTILLIQEMQLFRVEIYVGYNQSEPFCVMKGEVSYISQKIHSQHDYLLYITYASELVASWSQKRINFSFRSGINVYDMIQYYFSSRGASADMAGLSATLRDIVIQQNYIDNASVASVIDACIANNSNMQYLLSSDSSLDNKVISVWRLSEKRKIAISQSFVHIGQGNPTVTSQGLDIILFPVMNFCPGDILQINKILGMIDTSSGMNSAANVYRTFNTQYLDPNGEYVIREINYVFENRGNNFYYKIRAVAVSIFEGVAGVT